MTYTEEKGLSMENDLEISLMLELADKDFKAGIITAQGYQEDTLIINKMKSQNLETRKELNINSTNQKCNI